MITSGEFLINLRTLIIAHFGIKVKSNQEGLWRVTTTLLGFIISRRAVETRLATRVIFLASADLIDGTRVVKTDISEFLLLNR